MLDSEFLLLIQVVRILEELRAEVVLTQFIVFGTRLEPDVCDIELRVRKKRKRKKKRIDQSRVRFGVR